MRYTVVVFLLYIFALINNSSAEINRRAKKSTTTSAAVPTATCAASGSSASKVAIGYGAAAVGGKGGASVTVNTASALQAALLGDTPRIVYVNGPIIRAGNITVGSNKSIIGVGSSAQFNETSLSIRYGTKNVIVQNIKMAFCTGGDNDCITIKDPNTQNIWVDHCTFSGDLNANKDKYDGLIDVTRTATLITISNNHFFNHHKACLFGSGDSQTADVIIKVTVHSNFYENIGSRTPSLRFGHSHIFNNYYDTVGNCINSRDKAQALIENNVFRNIKKATDADTGFCVFTGNDLGSAVNLCPAGTFTQAPYSYSLMTTSNVGCSVPHNSGFGKI
ncbi:hypothetical protein HK096_002495 [Nowakowskiella sp. JEL0078]|nr:hypothetical protein HK096_002495 [Nowakowskiella sp. JEL0078]